MQPSPTPRKGQIVQVRQRTWLVDDVEAREREATVVSLSCLDDDAPGRPLRVLWDLEIDGRVLPEEDVALGAAPGFDPPPMFGAYLNALRWNCVTSTDPTLLQAPFRAGIDLKAYQLEPLRKALALPRVNLFIADDVGLGKTVEAGLVATELILRQRVDRILIVAPPAVTLQWQEEMEQRFGLPFAVYNQDFVNARRREQGWGVNPWMTHPRLIISYALLRGRRSRVGGAYRTQALELLLGALKRWAGEGDLVERSLLILDECHQAAPAGGRLYSSDTRTTRAIRQVAQRFEHRLFLSATPHNGHSSSFSALLEMLDPQRFTRVPIKGPEALAPVMVRRLKRDLRQEVGGLPLRRLVDHVIDVPEGAPEIELGRLLARYEVAYRACLSHLPPAAQAARALVCITLHKRLLSSIDAFHRTLQRHAEAARAVIGEGAAVAPPPSREGEDGDGPRSDAELDAAEDEWVMSATVAPSEAALTLLEEMLTIAGQSRRGPDPRLECFVEWVRAHLVTEGVWAPKRVVLFTEYDDTVRWIKRTLKSALPEAFDVPEGRVQIYHGGMGEARRAELKAAFNTDPEAQPLRILLCTDAAREGLNLQAHCADLFHFDLPWNPSRIEQRNGRIDRVLQPEPEVRCHYFDIPARPEDKVLTYLVRKLAIIQEELGSLSQVLSERIAARLEGGIRDVDPDELDAISRPEAAALKAQAELEGQGASLLKGDLDALRRQLDRSEAALRYRRDHLRALVDLGLTLRAGAGLEARPRGSGRPPPPPTFDLPPLDGSWEPVLAAMRLPPPEGSPPWVKGAVKPVAFEAAHRLDAEAVQLHLGHPLVQRLTARFRAQGFAAHDLHRQTLVAPPQGHRRQLVAFARLSLFGRHGARLHEAILPLVFDLEAEGLSLCDTKDSAVALAALSEVLGDSEALAPDDTSLAAALARAPRDGAAILPHLRLAREAEEARARAALAQRGVAEAETMAALLEAQRGDIQAELSLEEAPPEARTQGEREELAQRTRDERHLRERLGHIDAELGSEPERIRAAYAVETARFEPVGLVYLWPRS